jgi:hypothetical protein
VSIDAAALPSEDVTPVVQQQSVNTEDARDGVTDPPIVTPSGSNLFFEQQPTTTTVNTTMTPPVRVRVIDNAGAALPGATVSLSLNVPGVVLSGNVATTDESGVATFGALQINTPGTGYILTAIVGGATPASAQSTAFNVLALVLEADLSAGIDAADRQHQHHHHAHGDQPWPGGGDRNCPDRYVAGGGNVHRRD